MQWIKCIYISLCIKYFQITHTTNSCTMSTWASLLISSQKCWHNFSLELQHGSNVILGVVIKIYNIVIFLGEYSWCRFAAGSHDLIYYFNPFSMCMHLYPLINVSPVICVPLSYILWLPIRLCVIFYYSTTWSSIK